jgi:hypothetical protein
MELTKENLRDLTMRVRQSFKPRHRRKVSNHDALNTAMPSSIEFPFDPTANISSSLDLVSCLESRINR